MHERKSTRWSTEEVWNWYDEQDWPVGCNYVPSTAVNPTEMWQADTFDPETIDRELDWANSIGMNSVRVFLQYLVWEDDPDGLVDRMEEFLSIADRHGISTMFVFFDDVAFSGDEPYLGPQDDPIPDTHNSQWTPSPGHKRVRDRSYWPELEEYVRSIIDTFATDDRIICWDLYNEPGNSDMYPDSIPLVRESFAWAREAAPSQPVTAGCNWNPEMTELNEVANELSDVLSFHDYNELEVTRDRVDELAELDRPLLCTEWLARSRDNFVETHLSYYREQGIGCYTWGLVNGKLQTHLPWRTAQVSIAEAEEETETPDVWFHDLFHTDGTPYIEGEIETFREVTAQAAKHRAKK